MNRSGVRKGLAKEIHAWSRSATPAKASLEAPSPSHLTFFERPEYASGEPHSDPPRDAPSQASWPTVAARSANSASRAAWVPRLLGLDRLDRLRLDDLMEAHGRIYDLTAATETRSVPPRSPAGPAEALEAPTPRSVEERGPTMASRSTRRLRRVGSGSGQSQAVSCSPHIPHDDNAASAPAGSA